MHTWTPLFSKIVDSSIWSEPDHVVKVFLTMLAKKDFDFIVRGSAYNISCWAKKTEAETIDALKVLCSADTKRLEPQPFDGRRLEKVEGGYRILNGQYYHDLMRSANRRDYKAAKERQYYAKRSKPSPGEPGYIALLQTQGPEAADDMLDRRQQ